MTVACSKVGRGMITGFQARRVARLSGASGRARCEVGRRGQGPAQYGHVAEQVDLGGLGLATHKVLNHGVAQQRRRYPASMSQQIPGAHLRGSRGEPGTTERHQVRGLNVRHTCTSRPGYCRPGFELEAAGEPQSLDLDNPLEVARRLALPPIGRAGGTCVPYWDPSMAYPGPAAARWLLFGDEHTNVLTSDSTLPGFNASVRVKQACKQQTMQEERE